MMHYNYVCFPCRKASRSSYGGVCPSCHQPFVCLGYKEAVPAKKDKAGWARLQAKGQRVVSRAPNYASVPEALSKADVLLEQHLPMLQALEVQVAGGLNYYFSDDMKGMLRRTWKRAAADAVYAENLGAVLSKVKGLAGHLYREFQIPASPRMLRLCLRQWSGLYKVLFLELLKPFEEPQRASVAAFMKELTASELYDAMRAHPELVRRLPELSVPVDLLTTALRRYVDWELAHVRTDGPREYRTKPQLAWIFTAIGGMGITFSPATIQRCLNLEGLDTGYHQLAGATQARY